MSVAKEPLTKAAFERILSFAMKDSNKDAKWVVLLLRYTGCHISVIYEPSHNLREEEDEAGDTFIVWARPKKRGKEAYTSILKSRHIDFDVGEFANEVQKRRRRKSRQYFYLLVKRVGEDAGFKNLSNMSFRHTLGVDLAEKGVPREVIQDILNVSPAVLKTYMKRSKSQSKGIFKSIKW